MNKKSYIVAVMLLLMPLMAGAQALKGSYFLDNSLNRNKMNPAFAPRSGYFQLPAVGNLGAGALTNMELSTFLYPIDGQLCTFLNKNVPVSKFESALGRSLYTDVAADVNLINFGWKRGTGFWSVDMGIKVDAAVDLPRDLFVFMKKGTGTSGSYNVGNVKANATAAAQVALGYSRNLSDLVPGLSVGAKVRALLPVAYAGVDLKDVRLDASPEKWTLSTDGVAQAALKGIDIDALVNGEELRWNGSVGFAGLGFSADLGVEYEFEFGGFINGLSLSAAVTDLGAIKYNSDAAAAYRTGGQMDWTGLKLSLEEGKMDEAMSELEDEFKQFLEYERVEGDGSFARSTLPSFYLGAEMPFCNNLMSIGALYSAKKSYSYLRNELTLSYNLTPAKWFALGVNYSFLNVRRTMGCILELTPRIGPCIYMGFDYFPVSWVKVPDSIQELGLPVLPMSYRFNFQFGLAFAIGGKDHNVE